MSTWGRFGGTRTVASIVMLLLLPIFSAAFAQSTPPSQSLCDMPNMRGTPDYNKYCGSTPSSNSTYDYTAAQRAQEAAATEVAAQRQRDENIRQQRIAADNQRRMDDIARQAQFVQDRDAAAATLRGSTPGSSGALRDTSLRGSSATSELRGLKSETTPPGTDPMVVDARRVPTGLPKSVADSIPRTPAGERVRKGFQAIANHDWATALACFQDALNQEPGDPGLKRLVDLAQYMLQKHRPTSAARPAHGDPNEATKALRIYNQNLLSMDPEVKAELQSDEEFFNEEDPAWIRFFRWVTSKLPEEKHLKGPVDGGVRG